MPSGWAIADRTDDEIVFTASKTPIKPGKSASFVVGSLKPIKMFIWDVADSQDNIIDKGVKSTNIKRLPATAYTSDKAKFAMTYSGSWFEQEGFRWEGQTAVVMLFANLDYRFEHPTYLTNINIRIDEMCGLSTGEFLDAQEQYLKNTFGKFGFAVKDKGKTEVAGREAYFREFTLNYGVPAKVRQVVIPFESANIAYNISYGSPERTYPTYLGDFEKTLSSFEFTEQLPRVDRSVYEKTTFTCPTVAG